MPFRFRRPRYADVAATLALVFALGGTAYAVTALPRNSVNTQSIQDGAVTNVKIAASTIQGGRIRNGTITGSDVADGGLTGADIATDSIGLSDLVGANRSGAISFSLGANTCGTLNFGVGGAAVGQAVIMSYTGNVAMPPGVMFGPFRVVSAGNITARACNVTGSSISVSGIGVRFVTFG